MNRKPLINVNPDFARSLFPHFTAHCATECVRELFALTLQRRGSIVANAKATDTDGLACAAASEIETASGILPPDVQWMPPGRQTVQPIGFDEPFEMTVTPAIARLANTQLQQLRAAAAAGKDVEPYFDFNHKDEGRSFKPTRFFWAGEDPKSGGIRAEGTWTGAGAKAVLDGELCCVSASWVLHKKTKEFLGIKHNVGGLVPRSAFHSIQAFAKADSSTKNQNQTNSMTNEEIQSAITNGLTAGLKPVITRLDTLEANAKAAGSTASTANAGADNKIIELVQTAIKPFSEKIEKLETENKTQVLAAAKATVQTLGVKAGRIAAQDKDTIEFWEHAIAANAKATAALEKIAVNPAFVTAIANGSGETATGTTSEHAFIAKAKAHGEANKITDALDAQTAFAGTAEGRELYADYCNSLAPRKK